MIDFGGGVSTKILAYPAAQPTRMIPGAKLENPRRADDQLNWATERIAENMVPGAKLTTAKLQLSVNRFVDAAIKTKFKLSLDDTKARMRAEAFKRNAEAIRVGATLDLGAIGSLKDAKAALLELERRFQEGEKLDWKYQAQKKGGKYGWELDFFKSLAATYGLFGAAQVMGLKSTETSFARFLAVVTAGSVAIETIDKLVAKVHIGLQRLGERLRGYDDRMQTSFEDLAAEAVETGEIDEEGMSRWLATLGGTKKGSKGGRGGGGGVLGAIGAQGKSIKMWAAGHVGTIFTGLTIYGLYRSIKSAIRDIISMQDGLADSLAGSGARWQDYYGQARAVGLLVGDLKMGQRLTSSMADYGSVTLEASQSIMAPLAKSAKLGLDLTRDSAVQESIAAFAHRGAGSAVKVWGDITYRLYDIESAPLRRKALSIISTEGSLFAARSDTWFGSFANSVIQTSKRLEKSGMRLGAAEQALRDLAGLNPYDSKSKWKGIIERYGGLEASTAVSLGNFGAGLDQMEKFARDNEELLKDPLGVKFLMAKWEMDGEQIETLQALLKGDQEAALALIQGQEKKTEKEKLDEFFDQRMGTEQQTWKRIGLEWKELFVQIANELIQPLSDLSAGLLEVVKNTDLTGYLAAVKGLAKLTLWAIRNFSAGASIVGKVLIYKMKLHGSKEVMLAHLDKIEEIRTRAEEVARAERGDYSLMDEAVTDLELEEPLDDAVALKEATSGAIRAAPALLNEVPAKKATLSSALQSASSNLAAPTEARKGGELKFEEALTEASPEESRKTFGLESIEDLQIAAHVYLAPAERNGLQPNEEGASRVAAAMDRRWSALSASSGEATATSVASVIAYTEKMQTSVVEGMAEGFLPISDGSFQKAVTSSADASLRNIQALFNGSVWDIGMKAIRQKMVDVFEDYQQKFSSDMDDFIDEAKEILEKYKKSRPGAFFTGAISALISGLGSLSQRFESNGDPGAIGFDPGGGTSYGTYQIATRVGTMSAFMRFLQATKPEWHKKLSEVGNPDAPQGPFAQTWRAIAAESPQAFAQLQHAFIKATHYDMAARMLGGKGVNEMAMSGAMKEVLWSTAVQHGAGGAESIFRRAYAGGGDEAAIIGRIYAIRRTQFGKQPAGIQASVQRRFDVEEKMALQMLGQNYVAPAELPSVAPSEADTEVTEAGRMATSALRISSVVERRQHKTAYYSMIAEYAAGWFDNVETTTSGWRSQLEGENYRALREEASKDFHKIQSSESAA